MLSIILTPRLDKKSTYVEKNGSSPFIRRDDTTGWSYGDGTYNPTGARHPFNILTEQIWNR